MSSTQKWIIGILILISMAVSGFVVGQIKEVNTDLQASKMAAAKDAIALAKEQVVLASQLPEKYVLKEDFRCTIDDFKKQMGKMDDKLNDIMKEVRKR